MTGAERGGTRIGDQTVGGDDSFRGMDARMAVHLFSAWTWQARQHV